MKQFSGNRHECKLGIDVIKSYFEPLHPERFCIDVVRRRLRQIIILDMNDRKCKNFFSNSKTMRFEFKRHLRSPHRYIIHPFSKANALVEILFLLLMLFRYSLLAVKYGDAFIKMDMIADTLWSFYILSIFFTGYVNYNTKEICIHPRAIALHYLKTYFIFDMFLLAKTPMRFYSTDPTVNSVLTFLTIICFFVRFRTILFALDNNLIYFGANKLTTFLVYEVLKLGYFLHLLTCVFVVMPAYLNPEDPHMWLNGEEAFSRYETYCRCFHVVVCYFFGVDYELDTVDTIQNLVLFLLSFIGRLYTLELIARVLAVFGIPNISDSKYEQNLIVLRTFLRSLQLPSELRHRITTSFQKQSRKQYFDEREIQSHLTDHLKIELFVYGAKSLIEKHSVLNKIARSDLLALFTILESKMFFTNDVILLAGDEIEYTYFISSGTVAAYDVHGEEYVHMEEGDEFGLAWIVVEEFHISPLTWIALETTEMYCAKREDLVRYFSSLPEVARYFIEKVKRTIGAFQDGGGHWSKGKKDVLLTVRKGELLERQRRRLFTTD